jgi:hypothetical protein
VANFPTFAGGDVDCRREPCALVAFDEAQRPGVSAPLGFGPPPSMTVEPADGLLEGDTTTLTVRDLVPGGTYTVQNCVPNFCSNTPGITSGPDGTLTTTFTASQIVNHELQVGYCRTGCTLNVLSLTGGENASSTYSMAGGAQLDHQDPRRHHRLHGRTRRVRRRPGPLRARRLARHPPHPADLPLIRPAAGRRRSTGGQSNMMTSRVISPLRIRANAALTSSSGMRVEIMSSRLSRPWRYMST